MGSCKRSLSRCSAPFRTLAGAMLLLLQVGCASPNTANVDAVVSSFLCPICGGVAIGVLRDDRIVLKRNYGLADREQNRPIASDTVFELASLSKQFTGIALQILVQRGKVSMDDDVRKYVPEVPRFDGQRPITLRDLSSLSSGLADASPADTPTDSATFAWLSKQTKL